VVRSNSATLDPKFRGTFPAHAQLQLTGLAILCDDISRGVLFTRECPLAPALTAMKIAPRIRVPPGAKLDVLGLPSRPSGVASEPTSLGQLRQKGKRLRQRRLRNEAFERNPHPPQETRIYLPESTDVFGELLLCRGSIRFGRGQQE
jgi:hypothetical protein